jgi:hypothetical protein
MPRCAILALVFALAGAGEPARAADCDLTKPPTVPQVAGQSYKQARKSILAAGWKPVQGHPHNDMSANESLFRERGYGELQFCRITADSPCKFRFVSGNYALWVTTAGDENPALAAEAQVKSAVVACSGDRDPG